MAWDSANQWQAHAPGGSLEFGEVTLDSNGTVEVATMLSTIKAAFAIHKSGAIAATPMLCDLTITDGAVTLTDPVGAVNASAVVTYMFIGFP